MFTKYIESKQEEYEDVTDIKPTTLTSFKDKKYKTLKIKGTWNAPSQEEKNPCLKYGNQTVKAVPEGNPLCPTGESKKITVRQEGET